MRNMKVYVSGTAVGSYRAQNVIKSLLDNKIAHIYLPQIFFRINFSLPILKKIGYAVSLFLSIPIRMFLIGISTHIVLLPMNTGLVPIFEILFSKLLNKKIIIDFYISQFDTLVNDRKTCEPNSWGGRKAFHKDRMMMHLADKVIFLNQAEANYYQNIVDVELSDEKIEIIPLCVDYKKESFISNEAPKADELGICWWGTYIPLHGLEVVFDAIKLLSNKRIKLYVFGDSDVKAVPYKKIVKDLGLADQIKFENSFSFNNGKLAPELLKKCDLALGNFGSSAKAKTVLVNKVVDSLALGLPCLTLKTTASEELLNELHGVVYCNASAESIAERILHLSENREELKKIGERGKEVFLQKFNYEEFSSKLIKAICE